MRFLGFVLILSLSTVGCVATKTDQGSLNQVMSTVNQDQIIVAESEEGRTIKVPKPLVTYIDENIEGGMRQQVLNDMEAAVTALEIGQPAYTRAILADAYTIVETVYADNEAAKAARSKFVPESNKDFKGEVHERAMIGYYLGISDLIAGDMENAKVSFKWGELQDTMSSSEDYQSDFSLLNFLMGWTDQCNGDLAGAEVHYAKANEYNQSFLRPSPGDNLLVLAETGGAPVKKRSGEYGEELFYAPSEIPPADEVVFNYNGTEKLSSIIESIYFQATTRGGREIDKILAGKANFKEGAEKTSKVAAATTKAGMGVTTYGMATGNNDLATAGAIVSLVSFGISVGSKMVAYSTTPEADIRYWSNLPSEVHAVTMQKTSSNMDERVKVAYNYPDGSATVEKELKLYRTGDCYLAWAKDTTPIEYTNWDPTQADNWVLVETVASPKK